MITKEQLDIARNFFGKCTKASITTPRVDNFCKIYPEIDKELDLLLKEIPAYVSKRNIIFTKLNDIELRRCPVCNHFLKFQLTYRTKFCSHSCAVKSNETQNKIKKTSLERYGVEHPVQSNIVKEKLKLSNFEKYRC